jgi:hypothetical protein
MRENGGGMPRDPADVLCGREIDPHFLSRLHHDIRAALTANRDCLPLLTDVYNLIASVPHLRFYDLPRVAVDRVALNLRHRKAFVSNSISLHKFKLAIRRNHLLALKHEHIHTLLQAVIQAATDIAFRFHADILAYSHDTLLSRTNSFHTELNNLIAYANHELLHIHHDFKSAAKPILIHNTSFKLI